MGVSLLKNDVKKMLKRDLEMQSTLVLLLLNFLLSAIPSSLHLKKEQLRLWENIKNPPHRTNPCWAHLSIKTFSFQLTKRWFCFQMASLMATITHLSQGCAKNCQEDICQCIWDMAALILVKMRHVVRKGWKRERKGMRAFRFYFCSSYYKLTSVRFSK